MPFSTHQRRTRALPAPTRASVEPLEPRTLLSTLTLNGSSSSTGTIHIGTGGISNLFDVANNANLYGAVSLNGKLLFVNNDGPHGPELWRSDGSPAGTLLVKDINPGPMGSRIGYGTRLNAPPDPLFVFGNAAYFSATDGVGPNALWRTDGTPAGTYVVAATTPPPDASGNQQFATPPTAFFAANHTLFFSANGRLWRSDGTRAGTRALAPLPEPPYSDSATPAPPVLAVVGNAVYFRKDTWPNAELWKTDGTVAGTARVATDALVNGAGLYAAGSQLLLFNAANNALARYTPGATAPIFVTDLPLPSAAAPRYHDFVTAGGRLLFVGSSAAQGNTQAPVDQLWVTDGTPAGTRVLLTGNHRRPLGQLYVTGNTVYFGRGVDLWKTDGTLAGTTLVRTAALYDTVPLAEADTRTTFRGALYYSREGSLWRSDGTAAGTAPVATLPGNGYAQRATALIAVGDLLFFLGADDVRPAELTVYNPQSPRRQIRRIRTLTPQVAYSPRKHRLTIDGTRYNDRITVTADAKAARLTINSNDVLTTYPLRDVASVRVNGYAGSDTLTLVGPVPAGVLSGGDGGDTLTGGDANDTLQGDTDRDRLVGGAGDDRLEGGDERDTLVGGLGSDLLSGGKNSYDSGGYIDPAPDHWGDVADYSDRTEDLAISFDDRARDGAPGERDNVLDDVEIVKGGAGDDHVAGDDGYRAFLGNAGDDTLQGGASYQRLYGGPGNDLLIGGPAADDVGDSFDGGAGNDTCTGGAGSDYFDALDGDRDQLFGNGGDDSARADRRDRKSSIEQLLTQ